MARRSVRVTANVRKSQETRSQTRPLSKFPYVQNAPSVVQARLRGVRARRRLLRRASAGHNTKININKLNTDRIYHIYTLDDQLDATCDDWSLTHQESSKLSLARAHQIGGVYVIFACLSAGGALCPIHLCTHLGF